MTRGILHNARGKERDSLLCFENAVLIGFVHVFESAAALLNQWEAVQVAVLKQYNVTLRDAGEKAWNVYSIPD